MKTTLYCENSYYQGLVQNFYCGKNGCFPAFMLFFYQLNQSLIFCDEYSSAFSVLCEMELENCKILSKLLLKMGGDNKFFSSGKKFLSGGDIDYSKSFSQMFLGDIELLEVNVIELKNMIAKIENLNAKADLNVILQNKKKELKILREKYFKNNLM